MGRSPGGGAMTTGVRRKAAGTARKGAAKKAATRKATARKPAAKARPSPAALLAQREAELAVVNSIQQGLAAQLDLMGIVDLVGDKLRELFRNENVSISWYDEETQVVTPVYSYE